MTAWGKKGKENKREIPRTKLLDKAEPGRSRGEKEERVKGRSSGRVVTFCAYLSSSVPNHLRVLQVFCHLYFT